MTEKIKSLKLIHLAICAGIILFYAFAGQFTMEQLKGEQIDGEDVFYLVIPIAAFLLSNFMFRSQLKQLSSKSTLEEKFPIYQTASIVRWAILEGAAIIILFLEPNVVPFGILTILYLAFLRPTEEKVTEDLR